MVDIARADARIKYWEYKAFDMYGAIFVDGRLASALDRTIAELLTGIFCFVLWHREDIFYAVLIIDLFRIIGFIIDIRNRYDKLVENRYIYLFSRDRLSIERTGEYGSTPTDIEYAKIARADELKNCFYLFLGEDEAYIIPKRSFTNGMPEFVADLFQSRLGPKFLPQKAQ